MSLREPKLAIRHRKKTKERAGEPIKGHQGNMSENRTPRKLQKFHQALMYSLVEKVLRARRAAVLKKMMKQVLLLHMKLIFNRFPRDAGRTYGHVERDRCLIWGLKDNKLWWLDGCRALRFWHSPTPCMLLLWNPRDRMRGEVWRQRLQSMVLQWEGCQSLWQSHHSSLGQSKTQGHRFTPWVSTQRHCYWMLQLLKQEHIPSWIRFCKARHCYNPTL